MSEIAIRSNNGHGAIDIPSGHGQSIAQLVEWAQAADAAYRLAESLCDTQFAPAAYRGKPQEGAAAILAGAEVGLSPLASLRAFDNIQGTPAPKAMTLRAIVQGFGHDFRIDESTPERAVVSGRRKGDSDWQTSTWTIDRAQQMGLTGKQQWKQQPAAMLVARATAEVCRWIASDAIMGMPYTAEEIRDQGVNVDGRPAPRMVTASEILDGQGAEASGDPAAATESATDEQRSVEMVTAAQRNKMFGLWGDLGFSGDENRANRLVITAKILGLQGPLESSNDLTYDEAETVIAALVERKAAQDQARGGEQS